MEDYCRAVLKVVVAQICQNLGWHSIQTTPCDLLVDVLHRYLEDVARTTHRYSEQFGRTDPMLDDVGLAFRDLGISVTELEEYVREVEPMPFAQKVRPFPVPKPNNLQFPDPNCKEVRTRPDHIPPYLPLMYPEGNEKEEVPVSPASPSAKFTEEMVSPGTASPVVPGKRPVTGVSPEDVFSAKRPRTISQEGLHSPTREPTSVVMTSQGVISPVCAGKLPEARAPIGSVPVEAVTQETAAIEKTAEVKSKRPVKMTPKMVALAKKISKRAPVTKTPSKVLKKKLAPKPKRASTPKAALAVAAKAAKVQKPAAMAVASKKSKLAIFLPRAKAVKAKEDLKKVKKVRRPSRGKPQRTTLIVETEKEETTVAVETHEQVAKHEGKTRTGEKEKRKSGKESREARVAAHLEAEFDRGDSAVSARQEKDRRQASYTESIDLTLKTLRTDLGKGLDEGDISAEFEKDKNVSSSDGGKRTSEGSSVDDSIEEVLRQVKHQKEQSPGPFDEAEVATAVKKEDEETENSLKEKMKQKIFKGRKMRGSPRTEEAPKTQVSPLHVKTERASDEEPFPSPPTRPQHPFMFPGNPYLHMHPSMISPFSVYSQFPARFPVPPAFGQLPIGQNLPPLPAHLPLIPPELRTVGFPPFMFPPPPAHMHPHSQLPTFSPPPRLSQSPTGMVKHEEVQRDDSRSESEGKETDIDVITVKQEKKEKDKEQLRKEKKERKKEKEARKEQKKKEKERKKAEQRMREESPTPLLMPKLKIKFGGGGAGGSESRKFVVKEIPPDTGDKEEGATQMLKSSPPRSPSPLPSPEPTSFKKVSPLPPLQIPPALPSPVQSPRTRRASKRESLDASPPPKPLTSPKVPPLKMKAPKILSSPPPTKAAMKVNVSPKKAIGRPPGSGSRGGSVRGGPSRGRGRGAALRGAVGRGAAPKTPTRAVISETEGTIVDDHGQKIWICPACKMQDDGSPMIGCDRCDDWYHWVCVGIKSEPGDDEWFCEKCQPSHKPSSGRPRGRGRGRRKKKV